MVKEKSEVKSPEEVFKDKIAEFKKTKTKEELKFLAEKEKTLYDILDRLAAKKALEEIELEGNKEKIEEPKISESSKKKQRKK